MASTTTTAPTSGTLDDVLLSVLGDTETTTKTKLSKKEKKRLMQEEYMSRQRQFNFQREVAFSRVTHEKLKERLDKLLKKKYLRLIYGDAMHEWKIFLCSVTTKDKYIQALLEEIEHLTHGRKIIKQIQLGTIDEILRIYDQQQKNMSANYAHKKESYLRDRCHFIKALDTRTDIKLDKMRQVQHSMAKTVENELLNIQLRAKNHYGRLIEETEKVKQDLEIYTNSEVIRLWEEYGNIISNYTNRTFDLRSDLIVLSDKEAANRQFLNSLSKKLMKLEVQIKTYSESCINCKLQKMVAHYQPERDIYCNVTNLLRQKFREFNDLDENQISFLSLVSNKAIKALKEISDKIQTLLRYMSLSQRFETEEEKTYAVENDCEAYFPNIQELEYYKIMSKMYYRRSQIAIQTEFLQKVYDEEKEETYKLKRLIENVIHNFDIMPPEVINENEIFVKNIENI